jgi:hypothetical protein
MYIVGKTHWKQLAASSPEATMKPNIERGEKKKR